MNWIMENKEALAGIIGTAYVLARLIVVLTPTTKDNAIVNAIGKMFGLDKKQGVQ